MHSEPAVESRPAGRGRRRKRGNGSAEGPVFVDTSGRRSKVLRRIGLLVGAACAVYAGVLGAAFMGWGTSLDPSSLLPFGDEGAGPGRPGDVRPQSGDGRRTDPPSTAPSAPPSAAGIPAPTVSSSAADSSAVSLSGTLPSVVTTPAQALT